MVDDIQLGDLAKDKISGWEGMVHVRYSFISGSERFSLAGASKEGEPVIYEFDLPQLKRISKVNRIEQPEPTGVIKKGMTVRDKATEWVGTVTAEYIFLNGCIRYEVCGLMNTNKPVYIVFDEALLEPVLSPTLTPYVLPEPEVKRSGGSTSRSPISR
jgi:hypothetical protein